jgi:hypothetical protein
MKHKRWQDCIYFYKSKEKPKILWTNPHLKLAQQSKTKELLECIWRAAISLKAWWALLAAQIPVYWACNSWSSTPNWHKTEHSTKAEILVGFSRILSNSVKNLSVQDHLSCKCRLRKEEKQGMKKQN